MFSSVHITAALLRGVRQDDVVDKMFFRICCAHQLRFQNRFWDIAAEIRSKIGTHNPFTTFLRVMRRV